jgi:MFS family permease
MISETENSQTDRLLTTPHSAAAAGIISGVLFFISQLLINLAMDNVETGYSLSADWAGSLSAVLQLVSFAGITFLWFTGVARDRLGRKEDRFYATVFLGSGLLYLTMTFIATALGTGLLTNYMNRVFTATDPISKFASSVIYQVVYVFGFRMAAVYMLSSSTMWLRTRVMPLWLGIVTGLLALVLMIAIRISPWITLIFPTWMVIVSIQILISNFRRLPKHQRISS